MSKRNLYKYSSSPSLAHFSLIKYINWGFVRCTLLHPVLTEDKSWEVWESPYLFLHSLGGKNGCVNKSW